MSPRTSTSRAGSYDLVKEQGVDGALGIVQGEKALMHLEHHADDSGRHPYDEPGSFVRPFLPGDEPEAESQTRIAA